MSSIYGRDVATDEDNDVEDVDQLQAVPDPAELSAEEWESLEARFVDAYTADTQELLTRLNRVSGIKKVEQGRIKQIERMKRDTPTRCLARLTNPLSRQKRFQLLCEFTEMGARAVLLPGSLRGGDFMINQLFGHWAEQTVISMELPGVVLKRLGPSSASMPGEADHRRTMTTLRMIDLLEGKRPDLIAFKESEWNELSNADRDRVDGWSEALLSTADEKLLGRALFGAEVKISKWSYKTRRDAGVTKPLAVLPTDVVNAADRGLASE